MNYNISFECAALFFLIIIYIGVTLRFNGDAEYSRRYRYMLLLSGLMIVFDTASVLVCLPDGNTGCLPVIFLEQAFYCLTAWYCCITAHYIYSFADTPALRLIKIDRIVFVCYTAFAVVGIIAAVKDAGDTVEKILYYSSFIVPAYFACSVSAFSFARKKEFGRAQLILNLICILCVVVCSLLQLLFFPSIHLCAFGFSAGTVVMLYSLVGDSESKYKESDEHSDNKQKTEKLSQQTIRTLAQVIDARDEPGVGHSSRVAAYSVLMARHLGWDDKQLEDLRYAALLHDIGNINVPEEILQKHDRLTEEETARVRSHTIIGGEILKNIPSLPSAQYVARYHHECYDGSGYPDGLKGEDIPLSARIVAVAHAYDAMESNRPYRTALPEQIIRQELQRGRGTQFDPALTDLILNLLENGELSAVEKDEASHVETDSVIHRASLALLNRLAAAATIASDNEKDSLTGLYVRKIGEQKIKDAMIITDGCLVFFDLDNLKHINDTLGHRFGDRILSEFGTILSKQDCISTRIGGDEFLVFFSEISREEAEIRVQNILDEFTDGKEQIFDAVTLSAGLCMTLAGTPFAEASACADIALYYVKQNGKAGLYVYQKNAQIISTDENDNLLMATKTLLLSGDYSGAMNLEFREFSQMFAYLRRIRMRYETPLQLLLVTMHAQPDISDTKIEGYILQLKNSILHTVRATDIVTRYGRMQFLLILTRIDGINMHLVTDRIQQYYYEHSGEDSPEITWVYQLLA